MDPLAFRPLHKQPQHVTRPYTQPLSRLLPPPRSTNLIPARSPTLVPVNRAPVSTPVPKLEDRLSVGDVLTVNDEGEYPKRWKLATPLARGGFGVAYLGHDIDSKEEVVVKVEPRGKSDTIEREASIYSDYLTGLECVPKLYWSGLWGDNNVLVMESLGPSLKDKIDLKKRWSKASIIKAALDMVDCMEQIHKRGVLHRDVKPANFVGGHDRTSGKSRIFLIDFGLSQAWIRDKKVKQRSRSKGCVGTKLFASLSALQGVELQGPRDDLESLFYTVWFMLSGGLPWSGVSDEVKLLRLKQPTHWREEFPHPPPLLELYDYIRSLSPSDEPLYNLIRHHLRQASANPAGLSKTLPPPKPSDADSGLTDTTATSSCNNRQIVASKKPVKGDGISIELRKRRGSMKQRVIEEVVDNSDGRDLKENTCLEERDNKGESQRLPEIIVGAEILEEPIPKGINNFYDEGGDSF